MLPSSAGSITCHCERWCIQARIVFVWNSYAKGGGQRSNVSIPEYLDRRAEGLGDRGRDTVHQAHDDAVRWAAGAMVGMAVTPSFFKYARSRSVSGACFYRGRKQDQCRPVRSL